MRREPLVDAGVVVGNRFDKHGSQSPLVRWFMHQFDLGMQQLLEQTGPVRSVLEVGCGEGHVTEKLARAYPGARVLGTDFSATILELARRYHPQLEFQTHSIYDVRALGHWDLVVACEVFEHLEDPQRALDAVCEVADRFVLVTVPREPLWRILNVARGHYLPAWGNTDGHLQHWSRGALLRFLSSRLDIVDTRAPLPWTQALCRVRGGRT